MPLCPLGFEFISDSLCYEFKRTLNRDLFVCSFARDLHYLIT